MSDDWRSDKVHAAHSVVWQLDDPDHAQRPGDFVQALITAMCLADAQNLALLRREFPALGEAVSIYKNTWNGANTLRKRAGLEQNPTWPLADE